VKQNAVLGKDSMAVIIFALGVRDETSSQCEASAVRRERQSSGETFNSPEGSPEEREVTSITTDVLLVDITERPDPMASLSERKMNAVGGTKNSPENSPEVFDKH
jgi:hypothetical protein